MATRSRIGIELPGGKVKSIYCHWDGYPSYRIPLLLEHYSEREKVEQLIELGSISSLRPQTDNTIAYARDLGETIQPAKLHDNREAFRVGDVEEWGYLFNLDNEWLYVKEGHPENSQFMKAKDFKREDNSQSNAY